MCQRVMENYRLLVLDQVSESLCKECSADFPKKLLKDRDLSRFTFIGIKIGPSTELTYKLMVSLLDSRTLKKLQSDPQNLCRREK